MHIRVTVAWLCVALGLATMSIVVGAVWFSLRLLDQGREIAWIMLAVGGNATLLVLGVMVVTWAFLHLRLVRPLTVLARYAHSLARLDFAGAASYRRSPGLGELEAAVEALGATLRASRTEAEQQMHTALLSTEQVKGHLEALLFDLNQGVVVCNLDHQVLLYNRVAGRLLQWPEQLGLGRPLGELIIAEPVLQTLQELLHRLEHGCRHPDELTQPFVGSTTHAVCLRVHGHLRLIPNAQGDASGYVLTFTSLDPVAASDATSSPWLDTPRLLPPRPEFYDFDLVQRPLARRACGERLLRDLTYVVFDTETTGLNPAAGDAIVSLGGVRIVNRRVLTGETFYQLVNPERAIPQRARLFHGITDAMVQNAPSIREVLPQFKRFVDGAVLVAHNAAFDMTFLTLHEHACGVVFDNPVLDTLLLSAYLHDHVSEHDLDAVMARFGITVTARHTALGDAMATATLFVCLLDLLDKRHIRTLGQALDVAQATMDVRQHQMHL